MKSTLRNLINARIPSLLELKFGCEVKHPEFETKRILEIGKNYWRDKFDGEKAILLQDTRYQGHLSSEYGDTPEKALKGYEILGIPPTWSDCLRCLNQKVESDTFFEGEPFALTINGYIVDFYRKELCKVDLTKPVLEQTDEILQKLVDLIPNK